MYLFLLHQHLHQTKQLPASDSGKGFTLTSDNLKLNFCLCLTFIPVFLQLIVCFSAVAKQSTERIATKLRMFLSYFLDCLVSDVFLIETFRSRSAMSVILFAAMAFKRSFSRASSSSLMRLIIPSGASGNGFVAF
ncbi:hypothetical protein [Lunatibacter salilacus]|uniref:hypothetical protein n=1 Tax=Lunatibacter salilacus TaxID=2483804 RepID=UPI00131C9324|nr:hypothetical protein [Lunatibacter salilacus]